MSYSMETVRTIFKIHKGEGLKVFHFILLGIFLRIGIAIGITLTDTLFLVNVGAEKLPLIFMIMPFIMILSTPIYSYLVRRHGVDKIFNRILYFIIICNVFFFFLTAFPAIGESRRFFGIKFLPTSIFYIAKIYTFLWYITLYTTYWSFIDSFFDILDAKRLFPLFSGGSATGAMLGGALVNLFTRILSAELLFLVWSLIALLTILLLRIVKKRWRKIDDVRTEEKKGFIEDTSYVLKTIKKSRYILLINLVMFGTIFLTTVCEFQYMTIFSNQTNNAQELASLFGKLFAMANVFNLIINFFLFNRMISFIGVRNMTLVQPLVYLSAFGLLLYNYGYGAAIVGFVAYQTFLISIDSNNWNFIYNAVPSDLKASIRAFTENLCDPFATAIAGLFLLLLAHVITPQQIALIAIFGVIVLLVFVLFLRNDYLRAMITNLRKEWLDFSKPEEEVIKDIDHAELKKLSAYALNGDIRTAYTAINLLWLKDRSAALKALLKCFTQSSEKSAPEWSTLFETVLADEDDEIVRELMYWLEGKDFYQSLALRSALGSHGLIQPQKLLPLLQSKDLSEQSTAAASLLNSWNIDYIHQAIEVLKSLLEGTAHQKKVAIRALGCSKQERYAHFLVPYLEDSSGGRTSVPLVSIDSEIRQTALQSILKLANKDSTRLIPHLLQTIRTGDEKEKNIGIDVLGKIGDSECIIPLLLMSESFSPNQQRKVEKLITNIGLQSVPTIVSVFRGRQYTASARSIAARALSKLAFPQLEMYFTDVVNIVIKRAYEFLHYSNILQKHVKQTVSLRDDSRSNRSCYREKTIGYSVLAKHYRDIHTLIIEFILELLTIGGRLPDFELINSSLRSNNTKVRGNAIETIEQGISRNIFKLLLPLVDSRSTEETIKFFRSNFSHEKISSEEIVRTALDSTFPLECSAAGQIFWETSPPDVHDTLRTKLIENQTPLFQETISSLLSKREPLSDLNIVEKIYYLSQSPFFESFRIKELLLIAQNSVETHFDVGQVIYKKGDTADALYYVIDGEVLIKKGDNVKQTVSLPMEAQKRSGEYFGEGAFFGETERNETAYSEDVRVLIIYKKDIFSYAKIIPRIAIELLKNKETQDED